MDCRARDRVSSEAVLKKPCGEVWAKCTATDAFIRAIVPPSAAPSSLDVCARAPQARTPSSARLGQYGWRRGEGGAPTSAARRR